MHIPMKNEGEPIKIYSLHSITLEHNKRINLHNNRPRVKTREEVLIIYGQS